MTGDELAAAKAAYEAIDWAAAESHAGVWAAKYGDDLLALAREQRRRIAELEAVESAARAYTTADPMVRGEAYRDLCTAFRELDKP